MITEGQQQVCAEICEIMATYREQEDEGGVDTPGGLEHMGDVWRLLRKWELLITGEIPPSPPRRSA